MIEKGTLWWVDLGPPSGSGPGRRRPVLVVQSDAYTRTRLQTVLVAVVTSNTALATVPGNVFLPAAANGLPRDSTVNVTAVVTLDRDELREPAGRIPLALQRRVDEGLRRVLDLGAAPR